LSNVDLPLIGLRADGLHQTIASRTRRVYDSLAAVYPLSTLCFHSRAHRAALDDSGVRDGMRVLEVATGSGEMFRRLVKANPNGMTVGVDLSPNMAARSHKRVRRKYPRSFTSCQAVDARRMPFSDVSFDALVCCYLLELLSTEDIVGTVGEFHRVLRPGSTLTLILIGQDGPVFNQLYKVATSLGPAFWGRQVESRVPDLIEARGFEIQSDRHVRQNGYPSRVLVARR
jgi:ubiquinone/menaquinone biosynthesis C-methylase UbiE